MLIPRTASTLARDEGGLTLIELLVAITSGIVVMGALLAILVTSLHESSRIIDTVQATQLGRGEMTRIIDELHSACISRGSAPVQKESSGTKLRFEDAYGEEAVLTKAQQDEIVWEEKAGVGTLTDFTYPSNGGEWPKFTFSSVPVPKGGVLLGKNVTKTGSTPIFQYYKYATEATSTSESALGTLTVVEPPKGGLTAAEAGTIASVLVSFTTAPAINHTTVAGRSVAFSNQTTFAFASPASEATIKDGPCQ